MTALDWVAHVALKSMCCAIPGDPDEKSGLIKLAVVMKGTGALPGLLCCLIPQWNVAAVCWRAAGAHSPEIECKVTLLQAKRIELPEFLRVETEKATTALV